MFQGFCNNYITTSSWHGPTCSLSGVAYSLFWPCYSSHCAWLQSFQYVFLFFSFLWKKKNLWEVRQESIMKKASHWFVFPLDRQAERVGEGFCFLCCGDKWSWLLFYLLPQRLIWLSFLFWLICITSWIISYSFLPLHIREEKQLTWYVLVWRSKGPTLLHSLSASNSSHTRLSHSIPLIAFSLRSCFYVSKLSQHIQRLTMRLLRNHTSYILSAFPVFFSIFIIKKRTWKKKKGWMLTLFLAHSPTDLHSFSFSFQWRNGKQVLATSSGISPGAQSEHLTSSLVFVFPTHTLVVHVSATWMCLTGKASLL